MIPFTRYHLPNGRRTQEELDCSSEPIQYLADKIIRAGGRFELEKLTTGQISMTVCGDLGEGEMDIAGVLCRDEYGFIMRALEVLVAKAAFAYGKTRLG